MERIIKDYDPKNHGLTIDFLYESNDWDLIELDYNLDVEKLTAWYKDVSERFNYLRYSFNEMPEKLNIEKSKEMVEQGYCGYYCGPIDGITFAWPIERDDPLPPPAQANLELFPEINYETFYDDAKILKKFRYGYLNEMLDILGEDNFRQMIITTHYPRMYIRQHIDSKVLKLHIPVETNENSLFHFGPNRERNYHLKLGKIYILNTGDWHGTSNESDFKRSHIITRVHKDHLLHILQLTND
jgi:hypothetical protein